jgi:hypothetical protein
MKAIYLMIGLIAAILVTACAPADGDNIIVDDERDDARGTVVVEDTEPDTVTNVYEDNNPDTVVVDDNEPDSINIFEQDDEPASTTNNNYYYGSDEETETTTTTGMQ